MSADAKEKKSKKPADAAPAVGAAPAPAPETPRAPADPRLKVWKKFKGRFLPKGPLRDRLNDITARWKASEDHSGVTVEELKALHADWMTSRQKGKKTAKV